MRRFSIAAKWTSIARGEREPLNHDQIDLFYVVDLLLQDSLEEARAKHMQAALRRTRRHADDELTASARIRTMRLARPRGGGERTRNGGIMALGELAPHGSFCPWSLGVVIGGFALEVAGVALGIRQILSERRLAQAPRIVHKFAFDQAFSDDASDHVAVAGGTPTVPSIEDRLASLESRAAATERELERLRRVSSRERLEGETRMRQRFHDLHRDAQDQLRALLTSRGGAFGLLLIAVGAACSAAGNLVSC